MSANQTTTYNEVITRVNLITPSTSQLLTEANNTSGHGGGTIYSVNDEEYKTILKWIEQGAIKDQP